MAEVQVKRIDFPLLLAVLGLVALGLTFVFSATHSDGADPYFTLKRQMIWFSVGLVAMTALAILDYRSLRSYGHMIYAINLVGLLAVMLIGDARLGAQRWIDIGPFVLQPSEFSKVLMVAALAAFLSEPGRDISDPKQLVVALAYVGIPMGLIFIQPDLGTTLVIAASTLGILLVAGMRLKHFLILAAGVMFTAIATIKFHVLKAYQVQRLLVFLDPSADRSGAGYNLDQSLTAIGSGGFSGKGIFQGTQSTLNFLPHHDTDFIFSVIGEEWGFLGGLLLVGLFFFLIARILYTSATARDRFGSLLAAGFAATIFFQMAVNVGMTIGIMPITGIPLPLISYGGSSMMSTLASIGILLSVYARRIA